MRARQRSLDWLPEQAACQRRACRTGSGADGLAGMNAAQSAITSADSMIWRGQTRTGNEFHFSVLTTSHLHWLDRGSEAASTVLTQQARTMCQIRC